MQTVRTMQYAKTARRSLFWYMIAVPAVLLIGCDLLPQPPKARTPLEERGRHILQTAGGCGCHGLNFAGWKPGKPDTFPRALPFGERFIGPFGSIPASNITQDTNTGIGGWSDAQLEHAITEGITPGDTRLSPIMPYHAYHGMAHSDVQALVAYLRRLHPISNEVPGRDLKIPPDSKENLSSAPEDRPTDRIALGRYLIENVSACTDCHTSDEEGAEKGLLVGKFFHSGKESILAPNLTPDRETGIGRWSEGDIARYLRTGTRPDGGLANSVMAGLILSSFSHFTPEEAGAIAAYLKSLPPIRHSAHE